MTKIEQTEDELLGHLKDQIRFLMSSSESYDNGSIGEAKRLALVIRVLTHDSNKSTSLLTQLNKKNIRFYDTCADYDPNNIIAHTGLLIMKLAPGKPAEYVAPLDNLPPSKMKGKVNFDEWWNKIVFKDMVGSTFTRGDIIKVLADKEGGAHVDPELDADYISLSKYNSLGWKTTYRKDDVVTEADMGNPVFPSMRQISHEVIKTLKEEFSNLL